jgi:hypothetical protein
VSFYSSQLVSLFSQLISLFSFLSLSLSLSFPNNISLCGQSTSASNNTISSSSCTQPRGRSHSASTWTRYAHDSMQIITPPYPQTSASALYQLCWSAVTARGRSKAYEAMRNVLG